MVTAVLNPSLAPSINDSKILTRLRIATRIKRMMTESRKILAIRPETILAFSCGIVLNARIVPAMMVTMPIKNPMMARLKMLIRCLRQTAITPTRVATKVAIMMGMNMSAGLAAPSWARYTIMVTGIRVIPEAFSTRNMIIGFDA